MSWPSRQELLQSFTFEKLKEFKMNRIIDLLIDVAIILFVLYYCFFGRNLLVAAYENYKIIWNVSVWILPIGVIVWLKRSYKNIKYLNDILLEMKTRRNAEVTE